MLPVGAAAAPGLKSGRLLDAWLLIEIVSIEYERFVLGVEHAPKGLLGIATLADIVDFGNIEVSGADQIPDVAVAVEQFPALCVCSHAAFADGTRGEACGTTGQF